jgi:hypothetical protein
VPLPGHEADATPAAAGLAGVCIFMWNEMLSGTRLAAQVGALGSAEKRCVVSWMFHACVRTILTSETNARDEGVLLPWKRQTREAFGRSAVAFTEEACQGVSLTPSQFRLLETLRAAVRKHYGEPE